MKRLLFCLIFFITHFPATSKANKLVQFISKRYATQEYTKRGFTKIVQNELIQQLGIWAQTKIGIKKEDQSLIYEVPSLSKYGLCAGECLYRRIGLGQNFFSSAPIGKLRATLLHESQHLKDFASEKSIINNMLWFFPLRFFQPKSWSRTTFERRAETTALHNLECYMCAEEEAENKLSKFDDSFFGPLYRLLGYNTREEILEFAEKLKKQKILCEFHDPTISAMRPIIVQPTEPLEENPIEKALEELRKERESTLSSILGKGL